MFVAVRGLTTETTMQEEDLEPAGAAQGFHLLLMSPEIFTAQLLPDVGIITIGRSSKCEVQVEDPLVSREHARLHVRTDASGLVLAIEDSGSVNGTRVRDAAIKPGEPVAIQVGEAVMVGSTLLMALPNHAVAGPRRLWSHTYFEARVDSECARAAKTGASFALARLRFAGAAPWTKVLPVLARDLTAPHVFAAYGPKDYEVLFLDLTDGQADTLISGLAQSCRAAGLDASFGVASYPKHGRNADALLAAANASLAGGPRQQTPERDEIGSVEPAAMARVRSLATRVAASSINVLILGECGVGKDVLAQLIHRLSPRNGNPYVAFNCAAFSEGVLDSELFGHDRGAFTGATGAKTGLLESANGGTVFLDEIGDMPATMQAKLLRAIESREVRPVGALKSRSINVRFISATNKNLEAAVDVGQFRRDLLDRLNTMTLVVPPLRERVDEIPALATAFVVAAGREIGRAHPLSISAKVMEHLMGYQWPGNIRELKNVIERAVALCEGSMVLPEHLPLEKMLPAPARRLTPTWEIPSLPATASPRPLPSLGDPEKLAERQRITDALAATNGNQTRAAQMLGMPRRTFVSKLDYYGIPRPQKVPLGGPPKVSL